MGFQIKFIHYELEIKYLNLTQTFQFSYSGLVIFGRENMKEIENLRHYYASMLICANG